MTVKEPVGAGSALQVWLQLDQAGLQCRSSNLNPDCTPVTRQNMTETLNGKKTITYIVRVERMRWQHNERGLGFTFKQ